WMKNGGIAGWLIPSEVMDVNYGRAIKEYLLTKVTLLRIHRFDPVDVQFGDALVSSAVVWFRKEPPPHGHKVAFTFGGTLREPKLSRDIPATVLASEQKWTRFPEAGERNGCHEFTLGDFFTIKRGLATGDNGFFILTDKEVRKHHLPERFLVPILPSPRFVRQDVIEANGNGVPLIEEPLFMIDCQLAEESVKREYPALWKYLQSGIPHVSQRYLCRHREPWYSQEKRPPALFLCTYMGRKDTASGRPFRFILNLSRATAANSYLLLYPKPDIARKLEQNHELAVAVWKCLNKIEVGNMLEEGRVYGGGLHKLEPKELAKVSAEEIEVLLRDKKIRVAA
ncbi:MAG: SAM-dependent DNA methyltransferase, partial [Acidobacteria bacterium]|nr:SAM-dependent DNA methyltransferase [Acidobacteriota bacterium]